jgi:uncharacterized membrane protein YdjX (TVP38/TMEM64 family)
MKKSKLLLFLLLAAAIAAFFIFDLKQYFTLDYFKSQRARIDAHVAARPLLAGLIFFALYVAVTGLSLPGAAIMTLAGGAVFGLWWGTALVSFASTLGATLAFLTSRFLLRDWVQHKFGDKLKPINDGMTREGAFYLFALRLVPAFPFFVINLVMGLTAIRTWTFYWVSQLGMLAGTVVFVYAGTQLGEFRIGAGLILAFVLLGIFPLIAKKIVDALKARKIYKKWQRPSQCGGDRRGLGGPGDRLHRGRRKIESHAHRKTQNGWRLFEHRLRAVKGADPFGKVVVACQTLEGIRHPLGQRRLRFRRGDDACAKRHQDGGTARFRRPLFQSRRRLRTR